MGSSSSRSTSLLWRIRSSYTLYLIAGRRIRIKSGPLLGVEGTIVRRKGSVRLIVQVDLIQRAVLLELDVVDAQLTT
jgi:transcription antitermination factor NusG